MGRGALGRQLLVNGIRVESNALYGIECFLVGAKGSAKGEGAGLED